jgi:hypothetical protein
LPEIGDAKTRVRDGARAFLEVSTEPAYRRLVIQDAPAVLGVRRCREIEDQYVYGMLMSAFKRLKEGGMIDVANAQLAARMLGAMICEAALLSEDAKNPQVLERHALEIVERMLGAM